jgi:membrane protein YqaA with SNARE-associated domain
MPEAQVATRLPLTKYLAASLKPAHIIALAAIAASILGTLSGIALGAYLNRRGVQAQAVQARLEAAR